MRRNTLGCDLDIRSLDIDFGRSFSYRPIGKTKKIYRDHSVGMEVMSSFPDWPDKGVPGVAGFFGLDGGS